MKTKHSINSRVIWFISLGIILTSISFLMFAYRPSELIDSKLMILSPGNIFTRLWEHPPYDIFLHVFIFNVTNPDEFLEGKEKLKFQELGPYVYQEILSNKNATFFDNGTMTYYPSRMVKFRRDLSVGDVEEHKIVSLNVPLLGMTAALQDASILKNLGMAATSRAVKAESFVNITIKEFLWGYENRLITLGHKTMPSWITFEQLGFMDQIMTLDNGTNVVTLNLNPAKATPSVQLTDEEKYGMYHIHRWNGSPGFAHWGYQEPKGNKSIESNTRCNMVEGSYEGTIFPKNLTENSTIKLYRRSFCRPVPFHYIGKATTKYGMEGIQYQVNQSFLDPLKTNSDSYCYQKKGKILKKGIGNLAPCYHDMPIVLSFPHFLNADPWVLDQIDGLSPDKSLHDSSFILHQQLGIPLEGALRSQINLEIGETRFNPKTKPFNNKILPLFWLQLSIGPIPTGIRTLMIFVCSVLPVLESICVLVFGTVGLFLVASGSVTHFWSYRQHCNSMLNLGNSYQIVPILPVNSKSEDTDCGKKH